MSLLKNIPVFNRRLNFVFTALALSMSFFLAGCNPKQKTVEDSVFAVAVSPVVLDEIQETLDYAGSVRAKEEALVYPKTSGKIMEKIKEEGNSVEKGEVMGYIDRDEIGFTFEKAPIESPLRGIVGRVYVDQGVQVTPQTPIALVVDMDSVEVDLNIPEKYFPRVSMGQKAVIKVDAYPDAEFSGRVSKISPVVDTETRTAPIEITISNIDHRLHSGMFARIKLILSEHERVPVVLKESVLGRGTDTYVYVVSSQKDSSGKANIIQRKNIKIGIKDGSYYEVTEGLKEGDLTVVAGQNRLYEGALAKVQETRGIER
ncbi:MAG: efflux RND transporter periplasmic adaptor subunit [Candidatus Omnitrophica bacterium]|nr:efflux RND transporter periplasmic adaptor subunit [Candidatus Omnitrophota bacterium]MDD5429626.1 efflux RND transporter periplasmic adaptor subunit [Candidatus Omnitrophota bacterium]